MWSWSGFVMQGDLGFDL